ncbi:MAG: signal peptidase I [Armatimonadetes bacterium]|nr:signal peptidase I [Armatimonadota bacterium]
MERFTKLRRQFVAAFLYCLQVAVVTLVIILFVGRVSIVQGGSMEPSIVTGERILVNLLVYDFYQPRRGDVIVFKNPHDTSKDYIKRVIALPAETVEILDGATYVNGKKLDEPFVTHRDPGRAPVKITLKPDELFVMGDNRANSEDSRLWGPLPLRLVRGKASVVFWPPERAAFIP